MSPILKTFQNSDSTGPLPSNDRRQIWKSRFQDAKAGSDTKSLGNS